MRTRAAARSFKLDGNSLFVAVTDARRCRTHFTIVRFISFSTTHYYTQQTIILFRKEEKKHAQTNNYFAVDFFLFINSMNILFLHLFEQKLTHAHILTRRKQPYAFFLQVGSILFALALFLSLRLNFPLQIVLEWDFSTIFLSMWIFSHHHSLMSKRNVKINTILCSLSITHSHAKYSQQTKNHCELLSEIEW